jgi:transposase
MLPTFKIATGVALVLDRRTRRLFPFIERIYGDGGHQGPKAGRARPRRDPGPSRSLDARRRRRMRSLILPKRWIVERTFAWLSRFRGTRFQRYARTVAAFIRLAMIRIMLKQLVASPSS